MSHYFFNIFPTHVLDENALTAEKRVALLKVYIFNAALTADSGTELKKSIRGYFVCSRDERQFEAQLRDALQVLGLQLEGIERELEISEEHLLASLPHVHAVYRARGYGLELFSFKGKPKAAQRSTIPLTSLDEHAFIRQAIRN